MIVTSRPLHVCTLMAGGPGVWERTLLPGTWCDSFVHRLSPARCHSSIAQRLDPSRPRRVRSDRLPIACATRRKGSCDCFAAIRLERCQRPACISHNCVAGGRQRAAQGHRPCAARLVAAQLTARPCDLIAAAACDIMKHCAPQPRTQRGGTIKMTPFIALHTYPGLLFTVTTYRDHTSVSVQRKANKSRASRGRVSRAAIGSRGRRRGREGAASRWRRRRSGP